MLKLELRDAGWPLRYIIGTRYGRLPARGSLSVPFSRSIPTPTPTPTASSFTRIAAIMFVPAAFHRTPASFVFTVASRPAPRPLPVPARTTSMSFVSTVLRFFFRRARKGSCSSSPFPVASIPLIFLTTMSSGGAMVRFSLFLLGPMFLSRPAFRARPFRFRVSVTGDQFGFIENKVVGLSLSRDSRIRLLAAPSFNIILYPSIPQNSIQV